MRKVVFHAQSTLNGRIANTQGTFWTPFPWGEAESAAFNRHFRAADTWVLGRVMYEAIVPWWDEVAWGTPPNDAADLSPPDLEFAALQQAMQKVVFSRTLPDAEDRTVIRRDPAGYLLALKQQPGGPIFLSCGPALLAELAAMPGLIDEYLLAVHPAVLSEGPRLFDGLSRDLALRLLGAEVFEAGAVLLHYGVEAS
ncbi:dihydrofolate reductase family protein [Deinococcus apachensis]|uniref:dihydrofolate reductase family protein n=1 Tax=Deinococcus apachensis TaxID=309886 RepID=UPI0003603A0C|nr:dihydrofolate reductase family protein [Deinococcus apachensis]